MYWVLLNTAIYYKIFDSRQDPMFTPVKKGHRLNIHVVYVKMGQIGVKGSYIGTSNDIQYEY